MELFDAVYPLGTGSRIDNVELRYSLRSLIKNGQHLGRIFVIGERPEFLEWSDRLIHIPFVDGRHPYRNVWHKLSVLAEDDRISEKFVWMNDDFYIVQSFHTGNIPHYTKGGNLIDYRSDGRLLSETPIAEISRGYDRLLKNTLTALLARNLPTFQYNTHQPCNFEKTKVQQCIDEFRKEFILPSGLSFRCCYGNLFHCPPVTRPTRVVTDRFIIPAGRLAFASHKRSTHEFIDSNLGQLYPEPSEFERGNHVSSTN